ncbi:MAG TPA: preprotein translocase subunit YajC [Tepidisphaeraceae bacterium]|nr:preprotein translocase subunit YajC [Tepidisphaeraceae bacterium]
MLDLLTLLAQTPTTLPAAPTSQPAPPIFEMLRTFGPIILIVLFVMFFMGNSKKKQERERQNLLGAMKKNDQVQLIGGEIGTIVETKDDRVLVKVDESSNTKIWYVKDAISRVLKPKDAPKD